MSDDVKRPEVKIDLSNQVPFLDWWANNRTWILETLERGNEEIPSDIGETLDMNRDLAGRLGFVGTLTAKAKSYLIQAKAIGTEKALNDYPDINKYGISLVKDIAVKHYQQEQQIYDILSRLEASLVHKLDSIRTEISYYKTTHPFDRGGN